MGEGEGLRCTPFGVEASSQDHGVGGHELPGADRSARGPSETACGRRLLRHRDPGEVPAAEPNANCQQRLSSPKENGARHVNGHLSARWCTGSHIQKSARVVPGEPAGLLGEGHMATELTGPESHRKSLGDPESGARQTEPCSNVEQLTTLLKSAWAQTKPETLQNLVASMPRRVAKCLKMKGEYIGL